MASQFFGLNIAYTGLLASNAALNTTSNNIANVQTEGYSRQQVQQQAASALQMFQRYGCAGAGVETLAIERVRDDFYDTKYWNNNAKVGEYSMKQYYMEQVETYFHDDGKNAGFKTIFDQFSIKGIQELMKAPSDDAAKTQFVGFAGSLTEFFNGLAGNMEVLQKDVNQEIKVKVDQINSLASEIANLNKQINTIELTGVKANELRDRRTLMLDELSEIVDIQTIETPIYDTNNPERETGGNRFMVKIAGGQLLVDTNEAKGLECVARKSYEKVNQSDIDGLYDVYWKDGTKFNLYNASMGGDLRGLVEMRDGNNGENFVGSITEVGTTTDPATGRELDTVTVRADRSYLQDLNKCSLSDHGGIINLGNQEFYYDSWTYNYDETTNTYSYTFTISGSGEEGDKNKTHVTNDRAGKMATIGTSVRYQGVPYYMSQMNEWIRTISQKANDIFTSGYTSDNIHGIKMFTGDHASDEDQFDFPDGTRYDKGGSVSVGVNDDSYYRLTAKNFAVLDALDKKPSLIATKSNAGDGVEQGDLLKSLETMLNTKENTSFRGSSPSEFLQTVLSDVALNASRANIFKESFSEISYTIDNQRNSISGVDEDEEAINLVKYQNGYNLASKMIQTLTEIYDRLILQTGV
ncbi:MAG: flagellar hook-associated protein FlgK [Lachnospiraceae bacterium]|nr:flagellar hook-associated protein FlgK [Lachnospiraceae bacterium]